MEEWKTIYDRYEISNQGTLRVLPFTVITTKGVMKNYPMRYLKNTVCDKGYIRNCLAVNGKFKHIYRHQLVALAFANHSLCDMNIVIDHKNHNRLDNRLDNLDILSRNSNARKTIKDNKYGKGVCKRENGTFRATIISNGKRINLGTFNCNEQAAIAYANAAQNILSYGNKSI